MVAVGARPGRGGQPHPEPGAAAAHPRRRRPGGLRAPQRRTVGQVLRRLPEAGAHHHRHPDRVPGAAVHGLAGADGAVLAAAAADARGQRAQARRRRHPRGGAAGVLRGAAARRDPLLRRCGQRPRQRASAAALRPRRPLRDRGGLRDRADLRAPAGDRRPAGPGRPPAARTSHPRTREPQAAGDAGPRGCPGALGRARRGDGLPRLRPHHRRHPGVAPADRAAGVRGPARRVRRGVRPARRHHLVLARSADAVPGLGAGCGGHRRRGSPHRSDALPARPVGAARVAGGRLRRRGRGSHVRQRRDRSGAALPRAP